MTLRNALNNLVYTVKGPAEKKRLEAEVSCGIYLFVCAPGQEYSRRQRLRHETNKMAISDTLAGSIVPHHSNLLSSRVSQQYGLSVMNRPHFFPCPKRSCSSRHASPRADIFPRPTINSFSLIITIPSTASPINAFTTKAFLRTSLQTWLLAKYETTKLRNALNILVDTVKGSTEKKRLEAEACQGISL